MDLRFIPVYSILLKSKFTFPNSNGTKSTVQKLTRGELILLSYLLCLSIAVGNPIVEVYNKTVINFLGMSVTVYRNTEKSLQAAGLIQKIEPPKTDEKISRNQLRALTREEIEAMKAAWWEKRKSKYILSYDYIFSMQGGKA